MRPWHPANTLQVGPVRGQGDAPGVADPDRQPTQRTHGLSISSQRGSGGHGVEVGVLGTGKGGLVVGGRPVAAQQPSPLLLATSQDWAMSWQVGAVVPSGRRQSSLRLLVQVPGGRGRRITVGGPGPSRSPLPSPQLPWQPVSYETLLPGRGRWQGEQVGTCGGGRRSRARAAWGHVPAAVVPGPSLPQQASCGALLTAQALGVVAEAAVGQPDLEDPPVEDDAHADGRNLDAHLGGPRRRHGQAVLAEARPHPHLAKQDLGT